MPIKVLMPALSPTMTEGKLAKWLIKEGDTVESGDVMAEIETDKATMEVEAVDEGVVGKILVDEGTEGVAVNTVIAMLLEDGEDAGALEGADAAASPPPPAAPQTTEEPKTEPVAAPAPTAAPAPAAAPATAKADGGRIFASPLAKRMASMEGLDLSQLSGSGPHGRIVKRDIEKALSEGTGKAAAPTAAGTPATPGAVAAVPPVAAAEALALAEELRSENLPVLAELADRSVRSALKRADRAGVKWVVLVGEEEQAAGTVTVRDLEQGSQETLPRGDLATYLRRSK